MNTLMKADKYVHIIYYVLSFFMYLDLILIMIAPDHQFGIFGTCLALAIIPGILSTVLLIKKKSRQLMINTIIPLGIILILMFGPNI